MAIFFISRLNLQKKCYTTQIENGLHYKLDVGMNEDRCPIYRGYADRNLSVMRKIVLKLLNDEQSSQEGIVLKRMKAALSTQYLKKVVGF